MYLWSWPLQLLRWTYQKTILQQWQHLTIRIKILKFKWWNIACCVYRNCKSILKNIEIDFLFSTFIELKKIPKFILYQFDHSCRWWGTIEICREVFLYLGIQIIVCSIKVNGEQSKMLIHKKPIYKSMLEIICKTEWEITQNY